MRCCVLQLPSRCQTLNTSKYSNTSGTALLRASGPALFHDWNGCTASSSSSWRNNNKFRLWSSSRSASSIRFASSISRSSVRLQKDPSQKDLPQGLLQADETVRKARARESAAEKEKEYPPVIREARDNIRRFENCVVLTRVGGFYEFYFEHAEQYGPLLGLKVASKRTQKGDVPMAGFPFFQLDRYLKILVQEMNKYVAVSEEFPNDVAARIGSELMFHRKVTRVITPGTLVDEKFMDPMANNFCLAIHVDPAKDDRGQEHSDTGIEAGNLALNKLRMANVEVGLAWLDLSTGQFNTQRSTYSSLPSVLAKVGAKEIVMSTGLQKIQKDVLLDILGPEQLLASWQVPDSTDFGLDRWQGMLDSPMPEKVVREMTGCEIHAGSMLLSYAKARLQDGDMKLQPPVRRLDVEHMLIDRHTLRGLEILETLRDSKFVGAKGSLLHAVRRTVTRGGARLLRDRVTQPSTIPAVINGRLDLVEELLERPELKEKVVDFLSKTFDTQRLVQKFAFGKGDPDDLVSISRTISITKNLADLLGEDEFARALCRLGNSFLLDKLIALSERIAETIDEEGLIASHEQETAETSAVTSVAQGILGSEGDLADIKAYGSVARAKIVPQSKPADNQSSEAAEDKWIMRKTASDTLTKLHEDLAELGEEKQQLIQDLREETGAGSLTLQWTPRYGHYGHVSKKRDVQASMEAFPTSRGDHGARRTTRSFEVPRWRSLGSRLDDTKLRIRTEEQKVFVELRDEVVSNLVNLRRNAETLDELDVACSSATLAGEQNAVRPSVDESSSMQIVGGRHPTVTLGLQEKGRPFVANDCFMNTYGESGQESDGRKSSQGEMIHLVTGPNMAGKSTFLRQNGLFAIMAQVGLFVPAAHAHIGIVDALFARIGSADNLFSDQSTFMTEMLETALILRNATPHSLVVMDEVGRGTTPEDGLAVAYAALWHLKSVNRCRALFATHFHKLADMTADWDGRVLGRYCTDVREWTTAGTAGGGANSAISASSASNDSSIQGEAGDGGDGSSQGDGGQGREGGGFVYLHKVRPGVNRRSHALKVAGMAGVPEEAIGVAREVLRTEGGKGGIS